MRLPGVGKKRAEAILAQRARRPFARVDDVVAVKGVGPAWVSRARPNLSVGLGAAPAMQPSHAVAKR
jgi:competence protein ComEA